MKRLRQQPSSLKNDKSLAPKGLPVWWPPVWSSGIGWGLCTSPTCSAQPGLPLPHASLVAIVGGRRQMCLSGQVASHSRSLPLPRVPVWLHRGICHRRGRDQFVPAWRQMGSRHCAVDNVVDSSIRGSSINLHTTVVVTGVGAARGDPRRRPIVTWTVSLSMCNLNDEQEGHSAMHQTLSLRLPGAGHSI